MDVGEDNYQAVTLKEVLRGVIDAVPRVTNRAPRPVAAAVAAHARRRLRHADSGRLLAGHPGLPRPGDVLYVDNGTSFVLLGLKLPPVCTFIGSVNWGSIGYSVGALLGALTAAPDRRHLLFVGDGSFQVTAQELSTILRHGHKPVIFLINNGGYTIERGYLGKTEAYNDIANWSYADLPKVFRPDTSAQSFVVKTTGDLQNALSAPNDTMIFIESIMDPPTLSRLSPAAATRAPTSTTGLAARNAVKTSSGLSNYFVALHVSANDAVDGSSTGTSVPKMWALLKSSQ